MMRPTETNTVSGESLAHELSQLIPPVFDGKCVFEQNVLIFTWQQITSDLERTIGKTLGDTLINLIRQEIGKIWQEQRFSRPAHQDNGFSLFTVHLSGINLKRLSTVKIDVPEHHFMSAILPESFQRIKRIIPSDCFRTELFGTVVQINVVDQSNTASSSVNSQRMLLVQFNKLSLLRAIKLKNNKFALVVFWHPLANATMYLKRLQQSFHHYTDQLYADSEEQQAFSQDCVRLESQQDVEYLIIELSSQIQKVFCGNEWLQDVQKTMNGVKNNVEYVIRSVHEIWYKISGFLSQNPALQGLVSYLAGASNNPAIHALIKTVPPSSNAGADSTIIVRQLLMQQQALLSSQSFSSAPPAPPPPSARMQAVEESEIDTQLARKRTHAEMEKTAPPVGSGVGFVEELRFRLKKMNADGKIKPSELKETIEQEKKRIKRDDSDPTDISEPCIQEEVDSTAGSDLSDGEYAREEDALKELEENSFVM